MTDAPTAEQLDAEQPTPNLPAPLGDADGMLDLDRLRELAPQVRVALIQSLQSSAAMLRSGRGTVVVPEDTYDLVRRLTQAEEVLGQWASAFTAAQAETRALMEEEALTALGSYPGIDEAPSGSLFVPDGATQRIAVKPQWKSGESSWDVPSLVGWLIEDTVSDETCSCDTGPSSDGPDEDCRQHGRPITVAAEVAREVVDRLLALGRFSPLASELESLRKRLAGQQRDTDAAVIRQVRSVGPRKYQGVKVEREEVKP